MSETDARVKEIQDLFSATSEQLRDPEYVGRHLLKGEPASGQFFFDSVVVQLRMTTDLIQAIEQLETTLQRTSKAANFLGGAMILLIFVMVAIVVLQVLSVVQA